MQDEKRTARRRRRMMVNTKGGVRRGLNTRTGTMLSRRRRKSR